MKDPQLTGIPETIEQALETLTAFYSQALPQIKEMSQEDFEAYASRDTGMFIRDAWYLWWYDGHYYDKWPSDKPSLVKHFNDLGIAHPDNMSSILMTCSYRNVHNLPLGIEVQIDSYKDYWRGQGCENGIPLY